MMSFFIKEQHIYTICSAFLVDDVESLCMICVLETITLDEQDEHAHLKMRLELQPALPSESYRHKDTFQPVKRENSHAVVRIMYGRYVKII